MELRQLRDFVTVAKAGSFAAASRLLNVSQPGLGYQIKQLELDLGAELLIRHSRGIELTPAGAAFLTDAERILISVGEARARIHNLVRSEKDEIRVGLSPTPQQLLAPSLSALEIDGRPMRVSFRDGLSAQLVEDVRGGLLDVAICILSQKLFDLRTIPLYREHLHLVGPGLNSGQEVSFADLGSYTLTAGPKDHLPRQMLDSEAARQGIFLNIAQELEPGGLRRALVLHGNSQTVACCAMFINEIEDGTLGACRIVEPSVTLEVQMVCSPNLSKVHEEALLARIRTTMAAHPRAVEPLARPASSANK
ncbi:LysR family transcriptional regulator [Sphingobium sp.]|uniref:LysR family transcriptional regulator n=1 Tax=Sphingobium sp. TaxID=1912891 RepID=UPI0028BDE115|nr:LysR family transcriptional regulator [Sphingobium sp.]